MFVYKIYDILDQVVEMKFFFSILVTFLLFGCQTIEDKADKIGKKEIKEISKFLQQPESELKIEMGEPDEVRFNEKGSKNELERLFVQAPEHITTCLDCR